MVTWRVWTVVLAGYCGVGCATRANVYARAVDAQAAKCQRIADVGPQAGPAQQLGSEEQETLEACQRRLGLFRQLATIHDAEMAEVLEPPPATPPRNTEFETFHLTLNEPSTFP
jgi:hypothetical protein